MIPYAVESGDLMPHHLTALRRVREIVAGLPDGLTCHDVCRAVADEMPELHAVRGWFARRGIGHSWLRFREGEAIIDAYPWAAGSGPILITLVGLLNPWKPLYIPDDGG
jgi:hypothetical protein